MYSCSGDRDRTGAAERAVAFGAKYQPCNTAPTARAAASQVVPSDAHPPPRRPRKSASRRSSTTVVATDVSNFSAMVQELTGFQPAPAAIFRPQPRRAHAAASHSLLAAALQGHSTDAAATTGNGSRDAPAVVQPLMHPTTGVFDFDGLGDLGWPEFDAWPDLSLE
ncbi:hypothetical protein ACQ4PT_003185 [Festuca glaucescens]